MPRHTHQRAKRKHARAHTRFQRDLVIRRNWGRAKARYGNWRTIDLHPEVARLDPTQEGAYWPFTLPAGAFARNPFNHCSCMSCSYSAEERRRRRKRERRWWEADATTELIGYSPDEVLDGSVCWRYSQPRGMDSW